MPNENVTVDTAIGSFVISISFDKKLESFEFKTFNPTLSLPPGMSVENCKAVVLHTQTGPAIENLIWRCEFLGLSSGSGCCGEGLEAQEWEAGGRLVIVGTEDDDFLIGRLPFLKEDPERTFAELGPSQIAVSLANIPAKTSLSLHFVVAGNPLPEPAECSCWFAVDISHQQLVKQSKAC